MNPANDFQLAVFDCPMVDLPSDMTYEQLVAGQGVGHSVKGSVIHIDTFLSQGVGHSY